MTQNEKPRRDEIDALVDLFTHDVRHKAGSLCRKHKTIVHLGIVAAITVSLCVDGAKMADWLFVALSIIVEIN